MNKFVLAGVLFFAVQSQAQIKEAYQRVKQAVTGSAKLAQPHYFPSQWEFLARGGLTLTEREFKNETGSGFDVKTSEQTVNTEFVLGLTDYLSLGLNWDYDINYKFNYEDPLPDQKYKGSKDPVINLAGRVLNSDAVKADLKLAYQPKTATYKLADSSHDGNAVNGYRTTTVGAKVNFLVTDTSQVFLSADYNMLGEQDYEDQSTGAITKAKSRKSTFAKLGTLTEIVNDSFFGVTFSMLNQDGGITLQSDGTTTVETSKITGRSLTFVVKHQFSPNSVLDIQFEHVLGGNLTSSSSESKIEGQAISAGYQVRF